MDIKRLARGLAHSGPSRNGSSLIFFVKVLCDGMWWILRSIESPSRMKDLLLRLQGDMPAVSLLCPYKDCLLKGHTLEGWRTSPLTGRGLNISPHMGTEFSCILPVALETPLRLYQSPASPAALSCFLSFLPLSMLTSRTFY